MQFCKVAGQSLTVKQGESGKLESRTSFKVKHFFRFERYRVRVLTQQSSGLSQQCHTGSRACFEARCQLGLHFRGLLPAARVIVKVPRPAISMAQAQATHNTITLKGSTKIVTEFFSYAVNRQVAAVLITILLDHSCAFKQTRCAATLAAFCINEASTRLTTLSRKSSMVSALWCLLTLGCPAT